MISSFELKIESREYLGASTPIKYIYFRAFSKNRTDHGLESPGERADAHENVYTIYP